MPVKLSGPAQSKALRLKSATPAARSVLKAEWFCTSITSGSLFVKQAIQGVADAGLQATTRNALGNTRNCAGNSPATSPSTCTDKRCLDSILTASVLMQSILG
jgi:hypothetical protein